MLNYFLLLIAVVIIACVALNGISQKIGVPVLLAFIALGMLFGSDGLLKIPFENYKFAEAICSSALIFIMFYGGFGTSWNEAKPVAKKAIMMSTAGVVLTAGFTGIFCCFALKMPVLESFLIGAVISSTDAASVFSVLRSKKLNLKDNTASLLEVESGSNDPVAYMMTVVILTIMRGSVSAGQVLGQIACQVLLGLAFGVFIGFGTVRLLRKVKIVGGGFDTAFMVAVALLSYGLPQILGGNGYLSVYLTGIILGNSRIPNTRTLVHFFDGLTSLVQMLIFFLLGLLAFPSQMLPIFPTALAIALFLTLIARPISVLLLLTPAKCSLRQQAVISVSGLRGAASIVFAIMVTISNIYTKNDLFHIVFCIVLFSISIQGTLLPVISRKLHMIDDANNVMKTFNDYSEEIPVQFVKLKIKSDTHPWKDKMIRDIELPPSTLLVMVLRGKEQIIPRGDTILCEGDVVVLSAAAFTDDTPIHLTEINIDERHPWNNKRIADIHIDGEQLIILVQRGERYIIPGGEVIIRQGDQVVLSSKTVTSLLTRKKSGDIITPD